MDDLLRKTLRDEYSTPQACYMMLARAGAPENQIYDELITAGKIPESIGVFEELQLQLGFKTLEEGRAVVVREILESYEFPLRVVAVNGWEITGREYECVIFLQPEDEEEDSIARDFQVWFHNLSPIPQHFGFIT